MIVQKHTHTSHQIPKGAAADTVLFIAVRPLLLIRRITSQQVTCPVTLMFGEKVVHWSRRRREADQKASEPPFCRNVSVLVTFRPTSSASDRWVSVNRRTRTVVHKHFAMLRSNRYSNSSERGGSLGIPFVYDCKQCSNTSSNPPSGQPSATLPNVTPVQLMRSKNMYSLIEPNFWFRYRSMADAVTSDDAILDSRAA